MADTLLTIKIVFKPGGSGAEQAIYKISQKELTDLANKFIENKRNTYDVQTEDGDPRRLMIDPKDILYIG